jgi:hypothetical protein
VSEEDREVWVPVIGHLWGMYEVSNLGRVRSLARIAAYKNGHTQRVPERILKGFPCGQTGYLAVQLYVGKRISVRRYIHRIVAESFFGPCHVNREVCHNDGNPLNNRLENLRF